MLQLPDLDGLISDACSIGCKYVLKHVFEHLKGRGFRAHEILNGVADVLDEDGRAEAAKAARQVEQAAMMVRPKPQSTQDDDLGFL